MMTRIAWVLCAALLALACLAVSALADESGCTAKITLLGGEKVTVTNFGVRVLQEAFWGTEMAVRFDQGQDLIDIRKLRRLERLVPSHKVGSGKNVTFAFETAKGQKGRFKVDGGYFLGGETPLGDWSVIAGQVQRIGLQCADQDQGM